ncbi:MAG: hypothetical protein II718_01140 [Clostridiales bacterium]|nr:hypothetical protein [Clostridiales bacterium]
MTELCDLLFAYRFVLFVVNAAILYVSVKSFAVTVNSPIRHKWVVVLPLAAFIYCAAMIQALADIEESGGRGLFVHVMHAPALILGIIDFLLLFLLIGFYVVINEVKTRYVGPLSVKDGIDQIGAGLCYYWDNGIVKLSNTKINEISRAMTGTDIYDAKDLLTKINETGGKYTMPDGRVYEFDTRKLIIGKVEINELVATEVTEEEKLLTELMKKENELTAFNERLKSYGASVDEITVQKEILNTKLKIHDDMGQTLLKTKHFIESGSDDPEEKAELIDTWRKALTLKGETSAPGSNEGVLDDMYEAADAIGINMHVEGDLPQNNREQVRILVQGIRECLTNAYKYGQASNIYIKIDAKVEYTYIEYTNDGTPPKEKIKEGGGLSGLRKVVEGYGGKMAVVSEPEFAVRILLPERRKRRG